MQSRRIGLFGGSFDPPHLGHTQVAKEALSFFTLHSVWCTVTPQNPFKAGQTTTSFENRFQMCQLAMRGLPGIEVSDLEQALGFKRTLETLTYLKQKYPTDAFVLLIGEDNWLQWERWFQWQTILGLVSVVVAHRQVRAARTTPNVRAYVQQNNKLITQDAVGKTPGVYFWQNPLWNFSSSDVRQAVSVSQNPEGICEAVWHYIREHQLYGYHE